MSSFKPTSKKFKREKIEKLKKRPHCEFFYDTVEDTASYKELSDEFDKTVIYRGYGDCHRIWQEKKRFLLENGIHWMSPEDCNPFCKFK